MGSFRDFLRERRRAQSIRSASHMKTRAPGRNRSAPSSPRRRGGGCGGVVHINRRSLCRGSRQRPGNYRAMAREQEAARCPPGGSRRRGVYSSRRNTDGSSVWARPKPLAQVTLNYVVPEARFRGVSKELLSALEAYLRAEGHARSTLSSTRTAHRLYLAAGYVDAGEPQSWRGLTAFPMVKDL